jgi:hypothetical protein
MRKDIVIPKVEDVHVAIVREFNKVYKTNDWVAYLINNKDVAIEMVLIVSMGYTTKKASSTMRHKLEKLSAKSYAKIELMIDDVLELKNEFLVTYFEGSKMYDKTFVFDPNSISEDKLTDVPLILDKGILGI